MPNDRPSNDSAQSIGRIYQLVSEFVAPIVLGLVIDWQAGTAPWATFIGVFLGMTIGGWQVWNLAKRIGNNKPTGSKP